MAEAEKALKAASAANQKARCHATPYYVKPITTYYLLLTGDYVLLTTYY